MNLIHSLVDFRPSTIHGFGGFAVTAIPPGSRVIEYVGERITKKQSLERCARNNQAIFYLDDDWDLDGSVEWNPARFLNHSCSPNCDAERMDGHIWIVARRQIHPGEEVTFNYGYDLEHYREHPCRCGTVACVGFIVAEEVLDLLRARLPTSGTSVRGT
jgi:SET domain-containing protein